MFQLDLRGRKSIYEQVVDNLKELIITEVLKPEDKIPSVREMSKTLTVNPNTVQKSYRELESQGYIYTVSGLGTFVAQPESKKIDFTMLESIKARIKGDIRELMYIGLSYEETKNIVCQLMEEGGTWK